MLDGDRVDFDDLDDLDIVLGSARLQGDSFFLVGTIDWPQTKALLKRIEGYDREWRGRLRRRYGRALRRVVTRVELEIRPATRYQIEDHTATGHLVLERLDVSPRMVVLTGVSPGVVRIETQEAPVVQFTLRGVVWPRSGTA